MLKETDTKACDTRFKKNTPPLTADNTAAPRKSGNTLSLSTIFIFINILGVNLCKNF